MRFPHGKFVCLDEMETCVHDLSHSPTLYLCAQVHRRLVNWNDSYEGSFKRRLLVTKTRLLNSSLCKAIPC